MKARLNVAALPLPALASGDVVVVCEVATLVVEGLDVTDFVELGLEVVELDAPELVGLGDVGKVVGNGTSLDGVTVGVVVEATVGNVDGASVLGVLVVGAIVDGGTELGADDGTVVDSIIILSNSRLYALIPWPIVVSSTSKPSAALYFS